MKKNLFLALGMLAGLSEPALAAQAAPASQIEALEARIKALEANAAAMRQQAEAATAALEATRAEIEKLKQAGSPELAQSPAGTPAADDLAGPEAVAGSAALNAATDSATPDAEGGSGGGANAFNPAISVILNGQVANHSLDPDDYQRAGFPLAGEAGPGPQGLSLGESEISLAANIDDKFFGQLTLAVESEDGEDELGIEEAYIETTALPSGLAVRAGRFFSNIGYLNNHHAHTDKFTDRPLAYQAFLGNQYGDDGIQLRWVAPTDLFIELGAEAFRGEGFPSGGAANDGFGVTTVFAHMGGDIGSEASWLAGLSYLRSESVLAEDGFSGDTGLLVADLTWKWAPDGNTRDGGLQLRTEYFVDDRDGVLVDADDPALTQPWEGTRRGAYFEAAYRINRSWETGYRYDRLWADDTGPFASTFDPSRHSLMVTWHASEFSLLRLQLSRDEPNSDDVDEVISLQYQTSMGAHGAHKF